MGRNRKQLATTPSKPNEPSQQLSEGEKARAPLTLYDGQLLPKMIVFDLDYTLWDFWCDTHVSPPLKPARDGDRVTDSSGDSFSFYREVPGILAAFHASSVKLGLASRTSASSIARMLLKMVRVEIPSETDKTVSTSAFDLFEHKQIFPGDKRTHLKNLKDASGIDYRDILFFDDETRNRNVEELGVCFWLVRNGITNNEVDAGIKEWRVRRLESPA